ncbi:MAG: hypothetical protein RL338_223 [Chloroflexota bacterium]|jgi:quercetin dioxygenase-like cupin family protein
MTADQTRRAAHRLSAAILVATLAVAGCSPAPEAAGSPSPVGGIVRVDLGSTLPSRAPGDRLGIWRYTIPAGSELVPHTHPGWQVAYVASGTLTYTIIAGTATIRRADGTEEEHSDGSTVTVNAGDTVVENPDLQHKGANLGSEPIEIWSSTLFTDGAPPSSPLP